jgi:hypothetical protein
MEKENPVRKNPLRIGPFDYQTSPTGLNYNIIYVKWRNAGTQRLIIKPGTRPGGLLKPICS